MKKTKKLIAIILAMVLSFSSLSLTASASAINDDINTAEALIQSDSLGNLVEWLLTSLNTRKEEIVGTVLRIVFLSVEDESLKATIGSTDLMNAEDEQLAKILIDWLNTNLPEWTKDLTAQDWYKPVKDFLGMWPISITLDLDDVDGIVKTLYSLAKTSTLGDVSALKEDALKNVTIKSKGNLGVIHALFQFLADNTSVFKKVINGKLSLGSLDAIVKSFVDINAEITNAIGPDAIKELLCDGVELDYNEYKTYTADEIVAVAFLKLLTGNSTVSKTDAAALMDLSINDFLEKYAGQIYSNLLVAPLNTGFKEFLVENLKTLDDNYDNILDSVFNWDYEFKADTFDAILGAGKGNMVAQLNNAVVTLLKVILTDSAFKELKLKEGGNENLEENFTKFFRYLLPKIAKLDKEIFGASLSGFTADKVKNMTAEEMAVGVLKLFFPAWFNNTVAADLNKATTLEQLAVLAAKYAATNSEWVPVTINSAVNTKNVHKMSDKACIEAVFNIGMEVAAKSLDFNKATTFYILPENTADWKGADYLDDIADWALNFVKGLPAAADKLSTERGKLDGNGGFYKINVLFDTLFDTSFVAGCENSLFDLDFETLILDRFLGNLLNFDLEAVAAILAENEGSALFNNKINVAVIDLVDKLLTGLFEESYQFPLQTGDVDGDEKITAADARLALRASVKLENLTKKELKAADVTKDGEIKADDARRILRVSVKLETL